MGLIFSTIVLVVTAVLSWWISGYDPKLTCEDSNADLVRRSIRCGLTLLLMAGGLLETMSNPQFALFVAIAIAVPMVFLWINCLSEALAHAFGGLIDSPSQPSVPAPKEVMSDLDRLAFLSQQGHAKEALQLCAELMKRGEGSQQVMETMCFRLYSQMFDNDSFHSNRSLAPIQPLVQHRQYKEAESRLIRLLRKDSENLSAAFLLIRLYAQNLRQPEKAGALIQALEKKSKLPPMFAAYANHRIQEWLGPSEEKSDEGIESLMVGKRVL